jgi:hypothetical protein
MENENDKPNQQCEQTGGKSDKHQPTQHAQRIQKLAIIFPADDAGVYRSLIHLAPVRIRNPTANRDRCHRRQCHRQDREKSDQVREPWEFPARFGIHLKINSHRDGAGDLFVAAALPEFTAARIIIGHHDNDALDPGPAQTLHAFLQQTFTESTSLISRINRQMIDVSAASIVTA